MKRTILLFIFLMVGVAQIGFAQEINWMSMNEALELQKKQPKKIFVDAYTVWCGPCKMLDKYTFTNKDVVRYINENYYAVKFNAEGDEVIQYRDKTFKNPNFDPEKTKGRNSVHQFALAMGVSAYPTMVFFDEKGDFISPVKGYLKPEQLEIFLKVFASDDYKEMTTQEAWQEYQENFKGSFSS
ncbi:thioredoxin fold domain-containing protein [Gramella sp. GC03-9]|uniref:Thioredoxin fold domain-containing protein n=1 Tax=Christiangramia oceanisediminis TaxID=2920386 RepID=A0A9X2KWP4_9FLAO|nr:thioredoxin fold domain-containing protein [Gramella oceanisediminis]MCP9199664.1 thioredoxin fold domain-containing protein [Gramella oceanisediminis]